MNRIDQRYRDAALWTRLEVEATQVPPFDPNRRPSSDSRGPFAASLVVLMIVLGLVAAANLGSTGDSTSTLASEDGTSGTVDGPEVAPEGVGLPVTVEPWRDLLDGQQITVTGSGFPANTTVGLVMCSAHLAPAQGIDRCMVSTFTTATTDAAGNVSAEFTVWRLMEVDGRPIDCASDPPQGMPWSCSVVVGVLDDYDVHGSAPLHFDRQAPLEPLSALWLSQTDDLVDFEPVTITITDPGVDSVWHLSQCVVGHSPPLCGGAQLDAGGAGPLEPTQAVSSPDGGEIVGELRVRRMIHGVDCAAAPETCSVVIQNAETEALRAVRISFRPDEPLAKPSLVEVLTEPQAGASHLVLEIVGRSPSQLPEPLWQCPAGSVGLDGCVEIGEVTGLSPRGALAGVFVRPDLPPREGGSGTDCTVEGACVVRLIDSDEATLAEIPHTVVLATGEDPVGGENPIPAIEETSGE